FTAAGTCVVDADQAGNASFAAAPTVSASVEVEQAPAFTADTPPTTGTAGQSYAYTFAADGAPAPSFALAAGAPSWLSLDAGSGALSGTPPSGTTSFTYAVVATNVVGSVTAGPFSVTLAQPADPPVVDLSAALSCPGTSAVGTEGECTLTVHNAGPGTAESVTAAIVLPFRLRLVGAPGSSRWFGNGGAWWLGNLAPDASASFSATFRAVAPGRAIVVGGALSIEPGPSPADAFTSAPVVVTGGGAGSPWTAGPLAASSHRAHGRR
ncbi:MAG TPA: putative Ig domain-containing protein, partial [Acidimicrobiales bacterium]|nr:putative Ig domain-containing protein [Acidimicrobiales bacterium]